MAVVAVSLFALAACKEDKAAPAPEATAPAAGLATQEQKVSYILGMNIGRQFKANSVPLDQTSFLEGVKTGSDGGEPKLQQEEIQKTMMEFQQSMEKKQAEAEAKQKADMEAAATKNKDDGAKFLAENAKKTGVTTTASGLQYEVLKEGTGPKPKVTDTVTVNYVGTLLDGKEFDSSIKRNEPATFALNAVIPGWVEALQLMPEGSKWKVYLPSELAYGPGGTGGDIGPNATLVFEIELTKVGAETPAAAAIEPASPAVEPSATEAPAAEAPAAPSAEPAATPQ
jgi:FKBP-type peptidyl-prolyl cis-trans isomerase